MRQIILRVVDLETARLAQPDEIIEIRWSGVWLDIDEKVRIDLAAYTRWVPPASQPEKSQTEWI